MSDFAERPNPKKDLPQIPYDKIATYTALLGNPDDHQPQVGKVILTISGQNIKLENNGLIDAANIVGTDPILISLQDPTHEAALSGMAASIAEHLSIATTGTSLDKRDFKFEGRTYPIEEFNNQFKNLHMEELADSRLNKVFVVQLFRGEGDSTEIDPVIYFRPTYSLNNPREYKQQTDQKFFANLFNDIDVRFADQKPEIPRFIAKYALMGFPWPNRTF